MTILKKLLNFNKEAACSCEGSGKRKDMDTITMVFCIVVGVAFFISVFNIVTNYQPIQLTILVVSSVFGVLIILEKREQSEEAPTKPSKKKLEIREKMSNGNIGKALEDIRKSVKTVKIFVLLVIFWFAFKFILIIGVLVLLFVLGAYSSSVPKIATTVINGG